MLQKRDWLHVQADCMIISPAPCPSTQTVLVQVKENNWALHLRHKRWSVTYDL